MPPNTKTRMIILCAAVGCTVLLLASRIGGVRQPGSRAHAVSLGAPEEDEETLDALSVDPARFSGFNATIIRHAERQFRRGQHIFRFDTFGSEAFWGDTLKLHRALRCLSPRAALELGLKADVQALPDSLVRQLRRGQVDLGHARFTQAERCYWRDWLFQCPGTS